MIKKEIIKIGITIHRIFNEDFRWLSVLILLTSATSIILLPSGQVMWFTLDLTFSQVKSGVRRLCFIKIN